MNTPSWIRAGRHSLADLRTLQDWNLRYALETVPGVAEVATIGGYVRQYQVQLDPNKLLAYGIPLSTVIDRVKASTNEVGGRVLDLSGAEYMIRGLGYLHSLDDLRSVVVGSKDGTPVLLASLGTVSFGPDIREGVAEWNGEGETVGGIIVMRQGMNALDVINGVKAKLRQIAPSLPPGVEIMPGYDRSGLIHASIHTLQRDLLEEAIIVSLVIIVFLFHFRSALIAILALPIAVIVSFIPMYLLGVSSNIMSLGGLALAIGVLVDASIVMVENGYRHLSERQEHDESPVTEPERRTDSHQRRQAGRPCTVLFAADYRGVVPAGLSATGAGGADVPSAGMDEDPGRRLVVHSGHHARAGADGDADPRTASPGTRESNLAHHAGDLSAHTAFLPAPSLADHRVQSHLPRCDAAAGFSSGSQFMPPLYEGSALYMPTALPGISIEQAKVLLQEQDRILRSFPEVMSVFGTAGRSDSATDNAPLDMYDTTIMLKPREQWPAGMTYAKAHQENGREAPVSGPLEYLDHAGGESSGHGTDRHQNARWDEGAGSRRRRHPAASVTDPECPFRHAAGAVHLC